MLAPSRRQWTVGETEWYTGQADRQPKATQEGLCNFSLGAGTRTFTHRKQSHCTSLCSDTCHLLPCCFLLPTSDVLAELFSEAINLRPTEDVANERVGTRVLLPTT